MTAVHTHSMNQKVKKRAELALNDDFLRNAVRFTTERLRNGKRTASEQHGNWEEWRERGRQIRLHTIAHLDYYLNLFVENARANGVHIHFADTAVDAVRITLDIAAHNQARSVVKSKSMVSEELHLNQALEGADIETIESDLGEYIIQLAGEAPSHIVIPAIHKNRYQIAELLSKEAGEELSADTTILAGFVRKKLREKFLEADIGMTGCNFAIAETGSMVLFENEGNARMVSTLPKTQITLMGMERIIPSWTDLEVMATLLPRSATGQKLTMYMSGISGPRRSQDADGPEEMHIIIVDNGRSLQLGNPEFQELLNCIRCGACLNACPVYRHIGGHAYGGTYSGPIGAVLTPALHGNIEEWNDIASASSLCGACYEACPVKIPLHDMLVYLRRRKVEAGQGDKLETIGMKGFAAVVSSSKRFVAAIRLGQIAQKAVVRKGEITLKLGPLKGWNTYRVAPSLANKSFRRHWNTLAHELEQERKVMHPDILSRMETILADRRKGGMQHE
ncbi:LutB/LldF family L-lactate oxidation iron-sulfur protein [Paenibacillus polymyxa]|jgi:L-lactate dehydrogenase complex protein LldF|uniref:LutB/LldF family L-lactate oxidation iron-sulfur protein n=1 Tax=Paenibacillus polymyxa TaxID=1406 RepID=UPI000D312876|nr:LutB/LldF family L-lactate oxidation iron-sulfur protein [Paenibacillus polymyxa]MDP9679430.1 L-lactate dehydrogenase complex protein LldF [Paenibacillus jamilae]MBY0024069.1 iron-sulfur cluster-binding protein [Paenibacillus polymyxa]MBY0059377.1 iron-sulfur cluster-binding protein [Paenibacillus polymyxa]MBY0073193.1 iron-sulfur cluster-binding protein [Paenibacillus polymyxa]MBY0083441.1 iron-sulfur cluster-binding protein [Paenibacillus polymyxa]